MKRRTEYINNAPIDAVQSTILTPLPGTSLFNRMLAENRMLYADYPHDWQRFDFAEVVFNHKLMKRDQMIAEIKQNWDDLYNDKVLKKKFMRTLKLTRNITAAIWSYGSNLQYYNLVFEHERPHKDLEDIFGLDFKDKTIFDSNPFIKPRIPNPNQMK